MTNSILSLYRIFFIDDNHQLWAVMRDGRLILMKSIPPFASFSSDHTVITGVELDGEQTHFLWTMANFQQKKSTQIMTQNGYCYYPTLWNTSHAQLAYLRADLLNPRGTADAFIYRKNRTQFHLSDSFSASLLPIFFGKTGVLYYIDTQKHFSKRLMKTSSVLFENVTYFALSPDELEFAVYTNDTVRWVNFKNGQLRQFIAFDVTALSFNETGNALFFATYKNGRTGLYQYDKFSQEITLVLNPSTKITSISF